MKIDLHTHTREFSLCSSLDPEDLLTTARRRGLDGVVLTEHNRFWPAGKLRKLRDRHPEITVFNGAEIEVNSLHHVIVILPTPRDHIGEITRPDRLIEAVRAEDGYLIAAHPYRYFADYEVRNEEFQLDGVEIISRAMRSEETEDQARQLALEWDANIVASSDAHSTEPIGAFYTELDGTPANEEELIDMLRTTEPNPVINRDKYSPYTHNT